MQAAEKLFPAAVVIPPWEKELCHFAQGTRHEGSRSAGSHGHARCFVVPQGGTGKEAPRRNRHADSRHGPHKSSLGQGPSLKSRGVEHFSPTGRRKVQSIGHIARLRSVRQRKFAGGADHAHARSARPGNPLQASPVSGPLSRVRGIARRMHLRQRTYHGASYRGARPEQLLPSPADSCQPVEPLAAPA